MLSVATGSMGERKHRLFALIMHVATLCVRSTYRNSRTAAKKNDSQAHRAVNRVVQINFF